MPPQRDDRYAPPATLPGLLQRGRGQGALLAAEDPASAAALVHGCIRWEWRWDPQVDDRSRYLARLIRDLQLPIGPVVDLLAGDEDTRDRATGVLELLVLAGSAEARQALPEFRPERNAPTTRSPSKPEDHPASAPACPGRTGLAVLAAHGGESDVPALVAALERQWVDTSWCGPGTLARGLARFGPAAVGAASLLRRFWLYTPHSHERPAYLEALAAIGAPGTAEAFAESLWDCEAGARLLGVGSAPDRPSVRRRLADLRDDPLEEPEVREAAAARLAGPDRGASSGRAAKPFEGARVDA
ncbi:hypothetical protein [Kitasatospora sp. NPDC086791]|uniref:hypothetical protein n=1 Tax=Kitasatospora sp. NPDC086791 TaxID=3155178 RepID=UPI003413061A